MTKIIFDSDNTMGIRGCDIDDGLALLYAIGKAVLDGQNPQAYVAALCSSYGNNTLDAVHENTQRILRNLRLDLPLYRGAKQAGMCVPQSFDEREKLIVADKLRIQKQERSLQQNANDAGDRKASANLQAADATSTGARQTAKAPETPEASKATSAPETTATQEASEVSEAARFIARAGANEPGALSLAITGSTTNIGQALALDAHALSNYREVVFMGGITETLVVGDRIMNELNLSCDAQATLAALKAAGASPNSADAARANATTNVNGDSASNNSTSNSRKNKGNNNAAASANIAVITANNCLPAHFTIKDFEQELSLPDRPGGGYLMRTCAYWFDDMRQAYGIDGFCCWDVLVPLFILNPQLFDVQPYDVVLDPRLLNAGFLEEARPGLPQARITLPRIIDAQAVRKEALSAWHAALEALAEA